MSSRLSGIDSDGRAVLQNFSQPGGEFLGVPDGDRTFELENLPALRGGD